jgi:hypothetical protein
MSASPTPTAASPGHRADGGTVAAEGRCVSCGRAVNTAFCPHCGERRASDREYSLPHFAREAVNAFTNTDGKLIRTLRTLIRRPGELTAAYMRGERGRYMRPLQVFLLLNLAFFLFAAPSNAFATSLRMHMTAVLHKEIASRVVHARLATRGITLDQYRVAFDEASATQAKSLVIVMVPMFAMVIWLVNARRRRYALQHLVFSLHAFSVLFLILIAAGLLVEMPLAWWARARRVDLPWQLTDLVVTSATLLAFSTYLVLAQRRAYGDGRAAAVAKAAALCVGYMFVLFAYRFVLFFTAFWAT